MYWFGVYWCEMFYLYEFVGLERHSRLQEELTVLDLVLKRRDVNVPERHVVLSVKTITALTLSHSHFLHRHQPEVPSIFNSFL